MPPYGLLPLLLLLSSQDEQAASLLALSDSGLAQGWLAPAHGQWIPRAAGRPSHGRSLQCSGPL